MVFELPIMLLIHLFVSLSFRTWTEIWRICFYYHHMHQYDLNFGYEHATKAIGNISCLTWSEFHLHDFSCVCVHACLFVHAHERKRGRRRYHEAASSRAKRTPPSGARNAAATPAAAPQVIKSRRSRSFLKYLSHVHVRWYLRDPPWPSNEAMHAPVCTMGPSLPKTNPAETPPMDPMIW